MKKTGTDIHVPYDILRHPLVVSASTRNKVSPTSMSAILTSFIEACGGDTSAVNLHWSTAYRYKVEGCNTIAQKLKENWKPPKVGLVHWDGKLMDTLDTFSEEERLPILLSGIGGIKLLGVPALPHKSTEYAGTLVSEVTYNALNEWECVNAAKGMVFDTTTSNTGHKTAACVAVQTKLERPLLWFACRHHIGEIVLTHVWDALQIEVSKKPEVTLFERFKANFDNITHSDITGLDFPVVDETLIEPKEEIIKLCKKLLPEKFTRGDYKELITLTLLYLSDENGKGFTKFQRPGALHKARWMAKLLYTIKMVLLASKINEELPKGAVFAKNQLPKLIRFVKFAIFCYVPWWSTAPVSSSAPYNDLLLLKTFENYRNIDKISADAAIKAISNHLWYLTEELVPLALFSSSVSDSTKAKMVEKLQEVDKRICSKRLGPTAYGKPAMPKLPESFDVDLSHFVGEDSWSFFHILNFGYEFLDHPVEEWSSNDCYQDCKKVVSSLSIVNDGAERGVKLAHENIDKARKEDNFQNILQVIENDRKSKENQRKPHIKPKSWFLKL